MTRAGASHERPSEKTAQAPQTLRSSPPVDSVRKLIFIDFYLGARCKAASHICTFCTSRHQSLSVSNISICG